jgi:hypothetical protein
MSSFQKIIKYCAIAFAIFLAVTIISGIASAVVGVVSTITGNSVFHSDKDVIDYSDSFTEVESLDLNISTGNLIIKTGDTFRVEAEDVIDNFEAKVDSDGTLSIGDGGNGIHFLWFDFNGFNNPNSKITLFLPADFVAREARIETGAGKVTIDELNAGDLEISAGAGSIKGSNLSADEVKIDGGVGSIKLDKVSFTDADIDCGVGSLVISGELKGENKIDCGVGDVDLDLIGNAEDYELDVDAGVGSVRVDGEKVKGEYNDNSGAEHKIEVDGGVGSVRIDFAD